MVKNTIEPRKLRTKKPRTKNKLIRSLLALGALAAGSAAVSSSVSAAGSIGITLMGKPVTTDSAPIYDKGRVFVPLRAVSEALGADVNWNQTARTVGITKWTEHMSLTIGQQVAVI